MKSSICTKLRETKILHHTEDKHINPIDLKNEELVERLKRVALIDHRPLVFVIVVTQREYAKQDKKIAAKLVQSMPHTTPLTFCTISGDDINMSMDCVKNIQLDQISYVVLSPLMIFQGFHRNVLQLKANFKPHHHNKNFTVRRTLIENKKMYYVYETKTHTDFYFDKNMINEAQDIDIAYDFDFE